jgi:hypothetical protein
VGDKNFQIKRNDGMPEQGQRIKIIRDKKAAFDLKSHIFITLGER